MGIENFHFPLDDTKEGKKTEFVMCRLERNLFLQLKQKANERGVGLSNLIRTGCRQVISR